MFPLELDVALKGPSEVFEAFFQVSRVSFDQIDKAAFLGQPACLAHRDTVPVAWRVTVHGFFQRGEQRGAGSAAMLAGQLKEVAAQDQPRMAGQGCRAGLLGARVAGKENEDEKRQVGKDNWRSPERFHRAGLSFL